MSFLINSFVFGAGGDASITFTWDPENAQALPGGTTFTRASVKQEFDGTDYTQLASGAIPENSAAVGAGAQGFHPELAATNQVPDNDMTLGIWFKDDTSAVDNGVNSLGLNEYELDAGTTTSARRISDSAATGGAGSFYIIAKQGTGRYVSVHRGGSSGTDYATFDLQTGTITEEGGGIDDAIVTDLGDGWYKCEVITSDTSAFFAICISDTGTPGASYTYSFIGSNETILVCHVQYENTAFSTSPIVTSGSAVTRVAGALDTGIVIPTAFSALLDITLPTAVGSGNTITLLGPDATAEDVLRVDASFNVIMDDGGTPVTVGASSAGARIKVSYGRDGTGRSASLDGATAVTGGAPGAGHEGDNFQLGCANSVNQSRSIHHLTTLYNERKSDAELEALAA